MTLAPARHLGRARCDPLLNTRQMFDMGPQGAWPRLRHTARRSLSMILAVSGDYEMGLKRRWLSVLLLAVAIGSLAGCAATGPLSGDPCWGFFACTGWH